MRARQAASFARCCIATCAIFAPLLAYAAVPAAPDDVAVNFVTRNEISLSWTAPVGARRYKADYRRAGSGAYESYGPGATFTLPKLMVGMLLVNVSRPYLFESNLIFRQQNDPKLNILCACMQSFCTCICLLTCACLSQQRRPLSSILTCRRSTNSKFMLAMTTVGPTRLSSAQVSNAQNGRCRTEIVFSL